MNKTIDAGMGGRRRGRKRSRRSGKNRDGSGGGGSDGGWRCGSGGVVVVLVAQVEGEVCHSRYHP